MKSERTNRTMIAVLLCAVMLALPTAAEESAGKPSEWAAAEVAQAIEQNIVPERLQDRYQSPITRAEFAECAVRFAMAHYKETDAGAFVRKYASNDSPGFTDLTEETREFSEYAYRLGIVKGKSDTEFAPDDEITRQEAAVMLYRTYQLCGGDSEGDGEVSFTDGGEIASWAVSAVSAVTEAGVMEGVGEGKFNPAGSYTREQCYLTLTRMAEPLGEETDTLEQNGSEVPEGIFTGEHEEITTNYFTYEAYENGNARVTEYVGPDGIIVMQPELDGYAVVGIAADAFDGRTEVQLCVPDSVQYIESGAFPNDMKAVYWESEESAASMYAKSHGISSAVWDWEEIGYIKWARIDDGIERPAPVHGRYHNQDIAYDATTMIYCERSPEEDFEYTVENGEVTVNDYIGDGMYASIPETIEGYPVRTLGWNSFDGALLHHLEIPKTVRTIENYTCRYTANIGTIHVLDGEDCVIGDSVFLCAHNHVRMHNNIKEVMRDTDERALAEGFRTNMQMSSCIVPVTFEEVNGFRLSMFVYNAE